MSHVPGLNRLTWYCHQENHEKWTCKKCIQQDSMFKHTDWDVFSLGVCLLFFSPPFLKVILKVNIHQQFLSKTRLSHEIQGR